MTEELAALGNKEFWLRKFYIYVELNDELFRTCRVLLGPNTMQGTSAVGPRQGVSNVGLTEL